MEKLGCIADDFTGATDLAAVLASVGRKVLVAFGPDMTADYPAPGDVDAVVVALKSRTAPTATAVAQSRAAAKWLSAWGARQLYFKYCSTFDSTEHGNIGPVIDALLDQFRCKTALVAPAYPANARTVYQGHLFVGHDLLDESPMRHHPLTPMRESSLHRLLAPQTRLSIENLYLDSVRNGPGGIKAALAPGTHPRIVIADAVDDDDLRALALQAGPHVLLTGGAGLGLGLGKADTTNSLVRRLPNGVPEGQKLIVSGSASEMTRRQVAHARSIMPARKLDLGRLAAGDRLVEGLAEWVEGCWANTPGEPVLVYATDDLADLDGTPGIRRAELADRIENTLGGLAKGLAGRGLGSLIVAGGETSGRVVTALAIDAIRIGPEIAPGVVWAEARTGGSGRTGTIAMALKSGNFGDEKTFATAWEKLQ